MLVFGVIYCCLLTRVAAVRMITVAIAVQLNFLVLCCHLIWLFWLSIIQLNLLFHAQLAHNIRCVPSRLRQRGQFGKFDSWSRGTNATEWRVCKVCIWRNARWSSRQWRWIFLPPVQPASSVIWIELIHHRPVVVIWIMFNVLIYGPIFTLDDVISSLLLFNAFIAIKVW